MQFKNKGIEMEKGWKQTWKSLLFQHFELENIEFLQDLIPKGCKLDSFDGKFYIGLVSMNMTNVKHKATKDFVWFRKYNELNVRTYVTFNNKPGVLFLSLDVDSLISILGARVLYGLPYRYRKFNSQENIIKASKGADEMFSCEYIQEQEAMTYKKGSFAFWATERYFFANKYLGKSFIGNISHAPWRLSKANAINHNLDVLKGYPIKSQHPEILFCDAIDVVTSKLQMI